MKLSVLMPIYNEKKTILNIVEQVEKVDIDKELILVDDCSTDGTRELLKDNFGNARGSIRVIYHPENRGKGEAVRTALGEARGDYCIIQDADLEYDPNDYKILLREALEGNHDVVYGSRFLKTWRATSFIHFMINKFLTIMTNLLFKGTLTDMETCYKFVRTDVMRKLDLKSKRFELEPEITVKLLKMGYRIPEVPISYRGRSYHEGKKITWRDGIETVMVLLKYRFFN